jgi:hypothetical protein
VRSAPRNVEAGQRAQHPVERFLVRAGEPGEIVYCTRAPDEMIGEPQPRGPGNHL